MNRLYKNSIERFRFSLKIPELLKVDEILKMYPPEIKLDKDCLMYLIHLIYTKTMLFKKRYKDDFVDNGFVDLNMTILKDNFSSAPACMGYLLKHQIVFRDYYIVGQKSYGYKLNFKYLNGNFEEYYFGKNRIYWRLEKSKNINADDRDEEIKVPAYILKTFRKGVMKLDRDKSMEILQQWKTNKMKEYYEDKVLQRNIDQVTYLRQITESYRQQIEVINLIMKSNYFDFIKINSLCGRLHTPITSINKSIRKLITLNGEETISLDLKNCQPFFLLLFLKKWFMKERGNNLFKLSSIEKNPKYRKHLRQGIYNNTHREGIQQQEEHYPFMIPQVCKTIDNCGFQIKEFCSLVQKGILYDAVTKDIYPQIASNEEFKIKRRRVKGVILCNLFDANRDEMPSSKILHYFSNKYKAIETLISYFKGFKIGQNRLIKHFYKRGDDGKKLSIETDSGFANFSHLLQKIESKLMLEIVAKALDEQYPEIYFLTVHDCLIVPKSKKDLVKELMLKKIEETTGEIPVIDEE